MNTSLFSAFHGMPAWVPLAGLALFGLLILATICLLFVKIISKIRDMSHTKGADAEKAPQKEKPAKPEKNKKPKKAKKEKKQKSRTASEDSGTQQDVAATPAEEPSAAAVQPQTQNAESESAVEQKPIDTEEVPVPTDVPAVSEAEPAPEQPVPAEAAAGTELSDMELIHSVDALAKVKKRGQLLEKKEKEKSFSVKPMSPKKTQKMLKQKSQKLKIPKTVQDSIPYYAVYPSNGIIETEPGVFTRSYLLQDVNYQIAKDEEQMEMFYNFGQMLNGFEPAVRFQITINQKNINMDEFEEQTMLPMRGDGLDEYRQERNEIIRKKMLEGKNNMRKEKYLTVSAPADSLEAAETLFARLDSEVFSAVRKIGHAEATVLSTVQRLEILHDIYNIGSEGCFGNNLNVKPELNESDKPEFSFAEQKFSFDIMRRMGLTTKDMIGPEILTYRGEYGMVGDKHFRALYLRKLPAFLTDKVLSELTDTECNMITSIHYQSIDGETAQKLVRHKMTNINAGLVDKQKKASRAGYSVDLISPELQSAQAETNQLLEDINKKNQKLFYVSMVIVHFADTKEKLDSDTKLIQGIGRRLLLDVKKLSQQQENGLNAALPLAVNKLELRRVLTTESASVFMPFVNQELNKPGGMYYGNNAVSRNLITMDRRDAKNGNGFIFGTPGSGKSMSAKQEMMTVLLSSNDTVVVIDPEGEYYPMVEMLGGEVIRIAAGADVHINPFDIEMDSDSKDDPLAIKSDFIVSLCETAIAGQYGLAPVQRSIIDRCVRTVYEPYLASFNPKTGEYDKSKLPTLRDFYNLLRQQAGYDAMQLADSLEIYVTGSQNLFAHKTNVEYKKRFVVYDINGVGNNMKTMALQVILDNIWNRIVSGRKEGRYTWFYIDEIYLLFKTQSSAEFLRNLYKRARKYYGLPTGITQNVSDLLEDDTARTMISNCEFILMNNQAPLDRVQLAELLNISDAQLTFVTNANPGEGLIYNGQVIVPVVNKLPKDTKQYKAMTTKPSEVKDREKKKDTQPEQAEPANPAEQNSSAVVLTPADEKQEQPAAET